LSEQQYFRSFSSSPDWPTFMKKQQGLGKKNDGGGGGGGRVHYVPEDEAAAETCLQQAMDTWAK
jgi:hypothetical protein